MFPSNHWMWTRNSSRFLQEKEVQVFFLGFFLVASWKWKKNTDIQVIFKNSWACRQEAPLECSLHFSLTQTDWTSLHNSTSPLLPTNMIQAHENPKCAWIIGQWHGLRSKMVIERSKMQSNQPLWPAARTSERRCPSAGASPGATTHIWLFRYLEVGHPVKLQWNLTVDLSWTQNVCPVIASSTKQEIPERPKKPFSRDITWPSKWPFMAYNWGVLQPILEVYGFRANHRRWPILDDFFSCHSLATRQLLWPASLNAHLQTCQARLIFQWEYCFFGPEIPRPTTCDVYKTL